MKNKIEISDIQNKLIQAWYDQLEYEKSLQKNKDHGD